MLSPKQTKARRHHYVPLMIQRLFAGADLHLWSFDRRHPQRGIERKPIRRLFQELHLYTVHNRDGTRDATTETRLSVIEGRAGNVVTRLVEGARAGHVAPWSAPDRKTLIDLYVAQFRRAPDFHRDVGETTQTSMIHSIAAFEADFRPLRPEEWAYVMHPQFLRILEHNAIAANAAEPLQGVSAVMEQRGFSVVKLACPKRGFVLGSRPIARLKSRGTGRTDLGDPATELWFPIARDVALVSVGTRDCQRLIDFKDETAVKAINGLIARDSTVFASADRSLVVDLARRSLRKAARSSRSDNVRRGDVRSSSRSSD